jgi:curli biogenesis system outer membrane secretion channel CsgG
MWFVKGRGCRVAAVLLCAGLIGGGCASSGESARRDTLTENVGVYPSPPSGVARPRVGVPPFSVQTGGGFSGGGDLNALAADQMSTLLDASDRFTVIERAQLQKLLDEQNLEGIVRPGEMAQPAQVRGVDYLLVGRVTNLRVKKEDQSRGFGLGRVGGLINVGGADVQRKDVRITTEAGVDIRLVDPTSGEVVMSNFSEFSKTDAAGAMGVDILGASAKADANIDISEDDKGKILRLALDDALRKSLPKLDRFLTSDRVKSSGGAARSTPAPVAPPAGAATAVETAAQPAAAKKFCGECGKDMLAAAKFCPSCGAKAE